MQPESLYTQFSKNKFTFEHLLKGTPEEMYRWKMYPEKWCLLEIVCHLYDEEREDFRLRMASVLDDPEKALVPIDPPAWVKKRKYMEQDFEEKLQDFLGERESSLRWLRSLNQPNWDQAFEHRHFGAMSARYFLVNWLAHDYLHIRQIIRLKYEYLSASFDENLEYAGDW